jgi:general secretion pathway protein E
MSTSLSQLDPHDSNFAIDVVDRLVPIALQREASDIHLQPRDDGWQVLLRIDGVLTEIARLRGGGPSDPVTRLMVLASLPTYRSTRPMEGRIRWPTKGSEGSSQDEVSMRLGVFPTVHGPRAVIRLLRRDSTFDSIDSLGMSDDIRRTLYELSLATDGAILLSGPAGSGKTTTMYAMLRQIAAMEPRRSVMTIEDPVESVIDSISQSELDPSAGMTLSSALRSAMRQDSEVLLVSEVRDPETAEAALQASLTGHLVFSSVHATDVPSALRRLVQLGVPHYVVRSGVRAIISQRLVRRLCSTCRGESRESESREIKARETRSPTPGIATGTDDHCEACLGSGYRGRLAIAQCVRFDGQDRVGEALGEALESGASVDQMRKIAVEAGGIDLPERGRFAVEQGWTDEAELYRVLGRPRAV